MGWSALIRRRLSRGEIKFPFRNRCCPLALQRKRRSGIAYFQLHQFWIACLKLDILLSDWRDGTLRLFEAQINHQRVSAVSRYDVSRLHEAQFEPGSRGRVLKNLLGIRHVREMNMIEAEKLAEATDWAIRHYSAEQQFKAEDIRRIHRQWLGQIYPWAGEYRQVNIGKGGFAFAMSAQVPRLMGELERKFLTAFTPCSADDREKAIDALAIVHAELVLIHPFRDGNGRLARLFSTLMTLQAGLPLLDFSGVRGRARRDYFNAVQASLGRDYEPMRKIFRAVVRRSERG